MDGSSFRDLRAYRLASDLADLLYRAVARWESFERWTVGMQLVRAADSVGANIAEAAGRWHRAERRQLLVLARGSLYETEHWLERAEARGLDVPDTDLKELARTLSGVIRRHTETN